MKKLLAVLTLALIFSVGLAVSAANATHSNGEGPNHDFVQGTGKATFIGGLAQQLHVNAWSGPLGQNPQGFVFIKSEGESGSLTFNGRGEVQCLNVFGNRATLAFRITQSDNPNLLPEGLVLGIIIQDNGEPAGQDSFISSGTTGCPIDLAPIPPNADRGNFVVHDATP
jgi:hypothetical protein